MGHSKPGQLPSCDSSEATSGHKRLVLRSLRAHGNLATGLSQSRGAATDTGSVPQPLGRKQVGQKLWKPKPWGRRCCTQRRVLGRASAVGGQKAALRLPVLNQLSDVTESSLSEETHWRGALMPHSRERPNSEENLCFSAQPRSHMPLASSGARNRP